MRLLRGLALTSLVLGFGHVVFGAIVRITGSGLGCGDHWPTCQGYWIPPFTRVDLIIEVSHRYFAATLTASIVVLVVAALLHRRVDGVSGPGGILRPALLAAALVVTAALFGAVTVWMQLANKFVIVAHLALAMSLLASLVVVLVRSTEQLGQRANRKAPDAISPRSAHAASIAATLCFITIVLGALTAHIPGANTACVGFPLCRGGLLPTSASQYLQFTHRIMAFVLFFYAGWMGVALTQRKEKRLAMQARLALTVLFAQLVVAATMVEFRLPPVWRSLHEAVGTLAWIILFRLAYVARRAARDAGVDREPVRSVVLPTAGVRA
jgi:heme a synthase